MTSQQAIEQLNNLANNSKDAMRKAEFTVANNIALTAIQLAPENTGQLVNSIDISANDNLTSIAVGAPYAPYLEFGSGNFAKEYVSTLPKEWQDEAMRFFINGEGRTQAHPFFYPAIQQHAPELMPEIEKELSKLTQ